MALTKPQARQDKSIVLQNSIDITPDDIQDNQISIDQKNARINFISIVDNKRKVSTVFETEEGAVAAGAITEPILTSNDTNGTATVSTVEVLLRDNPNHTGLLKKYTVEGNTFTFTDGTEEYISVRYNNGNPIMVKEIVGSVINNSDIIPLFTCWRQGNKVHSLSFDSIGSGLPNKLQSAEYHKSMYARSSDGGLILGEINTPNPRTLLVSEALVYTGAISQFVGAFNSSVDQLTEAVITNGIWSYTDKLVYNNTQYNTSTGLVTLSNSNKWTVVWFYRSIGDAKQTFYVLGDSEYNNEAVADKAIERTDLPLLLRKHCIHIGRILIQYGMNSGTVESAFRPTYQSTNVINHNDTANKQGGTTNEYYHLTSLDYTDKILNRRFGTVSGGNYTEFESDGTVKLVGDASVYDDIFVGLASAKLPQVNVPTWTAFTTNTNAYTFAIDDYIDLPTIEVKHDYKEGTDLEVHLHIATNGVDTTNRYVKFIVYYTYAIPFSANVQFVTEQNISNELLIPANTLDKTSLYLQLGTIAGTTLKIGTQLKIRLKRITSVGAAPTANPFVGMLGIHYQKDTMGSRQINSK